MATFSRVQAVVFLKDPHRLIPAVHSLLSIRSFPAPDSNQKSIRRPAGDPIDPEG